MKKNVIIGVVVAIVVLAALGFSANQNEGEQVVDTDQIQNAIEDNLEQIENLIDGEGQEDGSETDMPADDTQEVSEAVDPATDGTAPTAALAAGQYALAVEQSSVQWLGGKRVGGDHFGVVPTNSGSLTIDEAGMVTGGTIELNVAGLTSTDVEDPEDNAKLVEHLNDADFLDTAQFPTASFTLNSAELQPDGMYKVMGDLTMRGVTNPYEAMVAMTQDAGMVKVSGEIQVDRNQFDIGATLADLALKDMIDLTLDLTFSA